MLETLAAFAAALAFFLICIPLWPFGLRAWLEWQRVPTAPDLETA